MDVKVADGEEGGREYTVRRGEEERRVRRSGKVLFFRGATKREDEEKKEEEGQASSSVQYITIPCACRLGQHTLAGH